MEALVQELLEHAAEQDDQLTQLRPEATLRQGAASEQSSRTSRLGHHGNGRLALPLAIEPEALHLAGAIDASVSR